MNCVRLFPFEFRSGPENMAADELLLEAAAGGVASLRFYSWSTPTLSLGYFQPASEHEANPTLAKLEWLRRSTGGAAILHGDGDLTYSVALPAGAPWHNLESWICRFHHLIRDELKEQGALPEMVVCGEETKLGSMLCFLDHTAGDVRLKGIKIVGSAQRKSRGALLQHGTLRLETSPLVPELPGIASLTGKSQPIDYWTNALQSRFSRTTGWSLERTGWSEEQELRIRSLAVEKYGSNEWNRKR